MEHMHWGTSLGEENMREKSWVSVKYRKGHFFLVMVKFYNPPTLNVYYKHYSQMLLVRIIVASWSAFSWMSCWSQLEAVAGYFAAAECHETYLNTLAIAFCEVTLEKLIWRTQNFGEFSWTNTKL